MNCRRIQRSVRATKIEWDDNPRMGFLKSKTLSPVRRLGSGVVIFFQCFWTFGCSLVIINKNYFNANVRGYIDEMESKDQNVTTDSLVWVYIDLKSSSLL